MRRALAWALFVFVALGAATSAPGGARAQGPGGGLPRPAEPPDEPEGAEDVRLRADLVLVPVSVRHEKGGAVGDLTPAEVSVVEDGAGQEIAFFHRDTAPLDVVLLVDASGSVGGSIEVIRSAALGFARQLRPEDRVTLVSFADRPTILLDWTNDLKAIGAGVRSIEPAGATALYGSVVAAVYERFDGRPPDRRRALVVLTDGDDTISTVTSRSAARAAIRHDASIYVVSVGRILRETCAQLAANHMLPAAERARYHAAAGALKRAEERLDHLAGQTGGRVLHPKRIGDLSKTYAEVAGELRSRYLLGYYPPVDAAAGFRAISVTTSRKGVRVHARQGYYRE